MAFAEAGGELFRDDRDGIKLQNYLYKCLLVPRIVGVFPYRISNGIIFNLVEVTISAMISLLSLCVIMVAVTIDVSDHSGKEELLSAMITFVEGVLVTVSIIMSTWDIMMRNRILNSIYVKLITVGNLVSKLPGSPTGLPSPRRTYIKLVYSIPLLSIILMETYRALQELAFGAPWFYLSVFAHCMCNIKLFGVAIEFAVFIETLGHYYKNMNNSVSSRHHFLTSKSLQSASEADDALLSALELVRAAFSPTLLIMVINCVVKSTANFNKLLREDKPYWILLFVYWIVNMLMQLLLVIAAANYTVKQANLYEWTMYRRIKNDDTTSVVSTQTKIMLFLIKKKKIKVDLCGFTTLDNGLLGKILAATLTYSIVLSQLNFNVKPGSVPSPMLAEKRNCTQ